MSPAELDEHQLHGVQPVLKVADMAAALAHYTSLGYEVDFTVGDPPIHARVSSGDRTQAGAARLRLTTMDIVGARPDRGYFWIHVGHDLDGLFAKLQAAGVDVVSPPETRPWGLRDFRIRDVDGNLFCYAGYL